MKKLHWYNCCNHGNDNERIIAKQIKDVTCSTCIRKIKKLGLKDLSEFKNLNDVPIEKDYCPVCGHVEIHNVKGHGFTSNHFCCPVKGFWVK